MSTEQQDYINDINEGVGNFHEMLDRRKELITFIADRAKELDIAVPEQRKIAEDISTLMTTYARAQFELFKILTFGLIKLGHVTADELQSFLFREEPNNN